MHYDRPVPLADIEKEKRQVLEKRQQKWLKLEASWQKWETDKAEKKEKKRAELKAMEQHYLQRHLQNSWQDFEVWCVFRFSDVDFRHIPISVFYSETLFFPFQ